MASVPDSRDPPNNDIYPCDHSNPSSSKIDTKKSLTAAEVNKPTLVQQYRYYPIGYSNNLKNSELSIPRGGIILPN